METRKRGLFGRLAARLSGSTAGLRGELTGLAAYGPIDEDFWEAVEETLMTADLGTEVGLRLSADLRAEAERLGMRESARAVDGLRTMLINRMDWRPRELHSGSRPDVHLVIGVNGTGKTTTAAKLAARLQSDGGKVVLGAADTFRAGAIEQLRLWAERIGADFVASEPGADPASVAYSAVEAGRARGASAVIIDTAGRLHTQANLMEELRKVERSTMKAMDGAPHETLLVLDAAIGQNSIQQARVFNEALKVTGAVMTKLDGSGRGGVILGLEEQLGIPVKLVGTGEGIEDLEPFDPRDYVDSLFSVAS
ncbi:MAG: fused signal recognition particle receptor [Chloroflexota bacterium]|jgi:fused signal recognition particle receptor|nr:fused signal recognition particle receptor [Chloroflexota bacterium]